MSDSLLPSDDALLSHQQQQQYRPNNNVVTAGTPLQHVEYGSCDDLLSTAARGGSGGGVGDDGVHSMATTANYKDGAVDFDDTVLATGMVFDNSTLDQFDNDSFPAPPTTLQATGLLARDANRTNAVSFRVQSSKKHAGSAAASGTIVHQPKPRFDPTCMDAESDSDDGEYVDKGGRDEAIEELEQYDDYDEDGDDNVQVNKKQRLRGGANYSARRRLQKQRSRRAAAAATVGGFTDEMLNNASRMVNDLEDDDDSDEVLVGRPQRIRPISAAGGVGGGGGRRFKGGQNDNDENRCDEDDAAEEQRRQANSIEKRRAALATLCALLQKSLIDCRSGGNGRSASGGADVVDDEKFCDDDWAQVAAQFNIIGLGNVGDMLARGDFGVPTDAMQARARLHAALKLLCGSRPDGYVVRTTTITTTDVFDDLGAPCNVGVLRLPAAAPLLDTTLQTREAMLVDTLSRTCKTSTTPANGKEDDAAAQEEIIVLSSLTLEQVEASDTWRVFRALDTMLGMKSRAVMSLINADCFYPHAWAALVAACPFPNASASAFADSAAKDADAGAPDAIASAKGEDHQQQRAADSPFTSLSLETRRKLAWICANALLPLVEFALSGRVFSVAPLDHTIHCCHRKLEYFDYTDADKFLATNSRLLQSAFWLAQSREEFVNFVDVSNQLARMHQQLSPVAAATAASTIETTPSTTAAASMQRDLAASSFHAKASANAFADRIALADLLRRLQEVFERRMIEPFRAMMHRDFDDTKSMLQEAAKETAADDVSVAEAAEEIIGQAVLACSFKRTLRWLIEQTSMSEAQRMMLESDIVGVRRLLDQHLDPRDGNPRASFWSTFGVDDKVPAHRVPLPILICWQRRMPRAGSFVVDAAADGGKNVVTDKTGAYHLIRHYAIFVHAVRKDSPSRDAVIRCIDAPYSGEFMRSATGFSKMLTTVYRLGEKGGHSAPAGYDAVFYPSASTRQFEQIKTLLHAGTVQKGERGVYSRMTAREYDQMGMMLNMEDGTRPRITPKDTIRDQWYITIPVCSGGGAGNIGPLEGVAASSGAGGAHYVHAEAAALLMRRAVPRAIDAALQEVAAKLQLLLPPRDGAQASGEEDDEEHRGRRVALSSVLQAFEEASDTARHAYRIDRIVNDEVSAARSESLQLYQLYASSPPMAEIVGPGIVVPSGSDVTDIEAVHQMIEQPQPKSGKRKGGAGALSLRSSTRNKSAGGTINKFIATKDFADDL